MKKSFALLAAALLASSTAFAASDTIVQANEAMNEKFSPFFGTSVPDREVYASTQLTLMTVDRVGAIVFNAIEGETRSYNGKDYFYSGPADLYQKYDEASDTTLYRMKIRDDLKFSDGTPVTIDDWIFDAYVFLDPSYDGATTLRTYPIVGLRDYLTQTSSAVYDKYNKLFDQVSASRDVKPAGDLTQEMIDGYWSKYDAGWKETDDSIVTYVWDNLKSEATKLELDEAKLADADKYLLAMAAWNLGKYDPETKTFTTAGDKKAYKVAEGERPTAEDFNANTRALYNNDLKEYSSAEYAPKGKDLATPMREAFISEYGSKDKEMAGKKVTHVKGIKRVDDYTVEVTLEGFSAPAIYSLFGGYIAPKHYYGDGKWDYEAGYFGHPYGDLSPVRAKTTKPMGAGRYKFLKYENRVAYFEANPYFFKGEPKIKYLQIKETQTNEVAAGLNTGVIDTGNLSGSKTNVATIKGYNSNGEISGDAVYTEAVDYLGYGYMGINASRVNVKGEPASDASKNLRRAFATVLAAFRNISYDSYYGEVASVVEYPISKTSWASPQPADEGYHVAFSTDVDGKPIYTNGQSFEDRQAAAKQAAIGFLKAAGYTWDDKAGKFTAAPEGARMSYEFVIGGGGTGDHPSYAVLTYSRNLLAEIGIELKITDPADGSIMWDRLDANDVDMWAAAWNSVIDPDMYQIYHSANMIGKPGSTGSNKYMIDDAHLDELIVDARKSDDQEYRKVLYKEALDVIMDWAVEVPAYQRKNFIIYSAKRVNVDTLVPDITTFYGTGDQGENLEMVK